VDLLRRILFSLVGCAVLLYAGDYVSVRYGLPGGRQTTDTVQIRPYMAIPQKNGREELVPMDARTQTCVISLFPHMGMNPCWYVRGHRQPRIDM